VSAGVDDDTSLLISNSSLLPSHLGHILALDYAPGDGTLRNELFPRGSCFGPGGWPGPNGAPGALLSDDESAGVSAASGGGVVKEGRGARVELWGNAVHGRMWASSRLPAVTLCRHKNSLDPDCPRPHLLDQPLMQQKEREDRDRERRRQAAQDDDLIQDESEEKEESTSGFPSDDADPPADQVRRCNDLKPFKGFHLKRESSR